MRKRKQKLRKSIRTFYIVLAISIIAFCSATIFNKIVKKDTYDKKETIKQRDIDRDMKKSMKESFR